jgi:hypothetical protein
MAGQRTETAMTVGDERPHAELAGKLQSPVVVLSRRRDVRRTALGGGDLAQ